MVAIIYIYFVPSNFLVVLYIYNLCVDIFICMYVRIHTHIYIYIYIYIHDTYNPYVF